jgi:hypothetical protein
MSKDIGLPSTWKGRMFQSFNKTIDWRTTINANLEEYGDGENIRVLIIGTGLENHIDLNGRYGYNLSGVNPYTLDDKNGRSTFVAGIIAANGNHHVKGIASKAQIGVVKLINKDETADFKQLETSLLWARDNYSSIVFIDLDIYNVIPLSIKKVIESLEANNTPVFINGRKNKEYDFTKYEVTTLHESLWLDNWYKSIEGIDPSLSIAVGLAAIIKGSNPNISTDEVYSKIDTILFPKKVVKSKRTKTVE